MCDGAAAGQQAAVAATTSFVVDVPLAQRVDAWVERTHAGAALDTLSAALSLLTVVTYMV